MAAPHLPEISFSAESGAQGFQPEIVEPAAGLADYGLEIDDWIDLHEATDLPRGIGRMVTRHVLLKNGSRNTVLDIYPERKRFGAKFAYTTPLGTHVRGYNTYVGIQAAREGMEVRIFGPPQVLPTDPHLSHEANAFAKVMLAADQEEGIENSTYVLGGYSMGGMKAPAEAYYLHALGAAVPLLNTIDPCLAEEVSFGETRKGMSRKYLAAELREGAHALLERKEEDTFAKAIKRLLHMTNSVSFHPHHLNKHINIGKKIWQGEAGTFIAHVPEESVFIAHFFADSRFNHHEIYMPAISELPYGNPVLQPGLHLTGMRLRVIENYIGQIVQGQEMVEAGATPEKIAEVLAFPINNPTPKQLAKAA